MIPVEYHTTASTNMRANAQGFLHNRPTRGTVLTGVVGGYCYDRDCMQCGVVVYPQEKPSPASIVNTLGKVAVSSHIANLQLFKGNQVVRRDERVCLLSGKIFTLPLDVEMGL